MERAAILAWRKEKRVELIAARMALGSVMHEAASAEIRQRLVGLFAPLPPALVGAYWPFRREYNIVGFLEWLAGRGHEVALPVVVGKNQPLAFRRWTRDMEMASGVYDIPYPSHGDTVRPSIFIIPMVGFDDAGFRLGYGGGFYDRTIATYGEKPLCVGVGFELGHLQTIHPLPHDIPMHEIATERALYRCTLGGLAAT